MREEASREAPGADSATDFLHFFAAVDVNQVNGEFHEESMDRATGHDPESSSGWEVGTSEQTLVAGGRSIGDFQAGRDFCTTSEVLNPQKGARLDIRLISFRQIAHPRDRPVGQKFCKFQTRRWHRETIRAKPRASK